MSRMKVVAGLKMITGRFFLKTQTHRSILTKIVLPYKKIRFGRMQRHFFKNFLKSTWLIKYFVILIFQNSPGMKRFILIFLLLVTKVYGDDWDFFQVNQKSFYQRTYFDAS